MAQSNHNFGGPILADTTYINNKKVQTNVKFELPSLNNVTAEIQAMGKYGVPLRGYFEDAEHKCTFDRLDEVILEAFEPKDTIIEHRWVQVEIQPDSTEKDVPYKAFVKGRPKVAYPTSALEVGNVPELECTRTLSGLTVYRDGKELLAFDRFTQTYRVNGKDYYRDLEQYL